MSSFKMRGIVMKSLFKKPATRMYPEVPREYSERTRGHIVIDMPNCILCGICSKKCPTDAITVDNVEKTWQISRMHCIQCSCCVEVCPKKCLTNDSAYTTPDIMKIVDTFEVPKKEEEEAIPKGHLECDDTCVFCGICVKKCPVEAITVNREEKEWSVDDEKCTKCGMCVESCPKNSLKIVKEEPEKEE